MQKAQADLRIQDTLLANNMMVEGTPDRHVLLDRPQAHCPIAKEIRRGQFAEEEFSTAIGDVDAQFL